MYSRINWHVWYSYHKGYLYRRRVNRKHFKSDNDHLKYNERWYGVKECSDNGNGYIRVYLRGKPYYAHRIIWEMFNGTVPEGLEIDHKDRNRSNNVISNLRAVTASENMYNSGTRPSKFGRGIKQTLSGKFGVSCKGTWLGSFETLAEAIKARQEVLKGN